MVACFFSVWDSISLESLIVLRRKPVDEEKNDEEVDEEKVFYFFKPFEFHRPSLHTLIKPINQSF